jgi:hypothetical protein
MSKSIRHASWLVVVVFLMVAGVHLSSSDASPEAGTAKVASAEVQSAVQVSDAEAPDVLQPLAMCSAIKCPPGQSCVNVLQCTPDGACFHVGRCVSGP